MTAGGIGKSQQASARLATQQPAAWTLYLLAGAP
jgi:hypothetical protein